MRVLGRRAAVGAASSDASGPSPSGRGFISYRRDDSDALATLLKTRLETALPKWSFFLDFGSIPAGTDFKQVIEDGLIGADLVLVVIDKDWLGLRKSPGGRIHDDDDFIRFEVATALGAGKRTIPVLVNDARMPRAAMLPPDIAPITRLNAIELRLSRFDDDVRGLARAIAGSVPEGGAVRSFVPALRRGAAGAAIATIVAAVALGLQYWATGRPLSYWVGATEATVLVGLWIALGAIAGRSLRR